MADASPVVVQTFRNRSSADVAQGVLAAQGIKAEIVSDDADGLHPELALNQGVNLIVAEGDVAVARSVLGADLSPSGQADDAPNRGRVRIIAAALAFFVLATVVVSFVARSDWGARPDSSSIAR